jgi:hypothetical protein
MGVKLFFGFSAKSSSCSRTLPAWLKFFGSLQLKHQLPLPSSYVAKASEDVPQGHAPLVQEAISFP